MEHAHPNPALVKNSMDVRRHRTESPTSHADSPIRTSDEDTRSRALYRKARSSSPAKRTNRNRASTTPSTSDRRSISQNGTSKVDSPDRRTQEGALDADTARLLEGMEPVKPVSKMNKAEVGPPLFRPTLIIFILRPRSSIALLSRSLRLGDALQSS